MNPDVVMNIDATVDMDDSDVSVSDAETILENKLPGSFNIQTSKHFRTSSPSRTPTLAPSTTAVPTAVPSITGSVASISLTSVTSDEMTDIGLDRIKDKLAEIYDVDTDDIEVNTLYSANGQMKIIRLRVMIKIKY